MKKVHFSAIAGKAMAPLAVMMKDLGWKVTGSDEKVYDPMKSFLDNSGIEWYQDFNADRIKDADLVVIGGAALIKDPNDPEYVEAKKLGKEIIGYADLLQKFVIKENSIVVAGTYGKTTTSSIMAWVLDYVGLNPSFMSGGPQIHFDSGVRATDSKYSVLEGDEYVSVMIHDMEPRFIYYKPTHTIITAAQWDHVNIYPTENDYINAFRKLLSKTKENDGIVLFCATGKNNDILYSECLSPKYSYAVEGKQTYFKGEIHYISKIDHPTKEATFFKLYVNDELIGEYSTQLLGVDNLENATSVLATCHIMKLDMKKAGEGLAKFKGVGNRQEIRGNTKEGAIVIDDIAHSAVKAKSTLEALRTRYKDEKIIAIFDPHATALADRKTLEWYPGAFDLANKVIIPKVTVKKSTPNEERVYGKDIVEAIAKTQPQVEYIPLDDNIIKYIRQNSDKNTLVVFMSSGSWRGLIETLLEK